MNEQLAIKLTKLSEAVAQDVRENIFAALTDKGAKVLNAELATNIVNVTVGTITFLLAGLLASAVRPGHREELLKDVFAEALVVADLYKEEAKKQDPARRLVLPTPRESADINRKES